MLLKYIYTKFFLSVAKVKWNIVEFLSNSPSYVTNSKLLKTSSVNALFWYPNLDHFVLAPLNFGESHKNKSSTYFNLANLCKMCANSYKLMWSITQNLAIWENSLKSLKLCAVKTKRSKKMYSFAQWACLLDLDFFFRIFTKGAF